ncbi:hypothetical protein Ahy_A03g011011 isoform A [Arachis hypogaea]|uniref:Peptidase A1 domain-containing protein n=1 Tax=Arachis hypogaea TaxID=3818 RepID=A0A445DPA4_ARAHY|nr:hypothetical protein Ahy_A03g011011 isoform B [Arachis hypogaea]RYR65009.1 hypothetical protein Ahy_A03g011011 isoform A [Arachis hypogaea]
MKASKYDVPIKTITLLDTGSCATVVRPDLLPPEAWIPFNKKFIASNKEIFTIDLISKENVGFQIFSGATTWLRVLGSYLPEQDILFGFDAYYRIRSDIGYIRKTQKIFLKAYFY